MSLTNCIIILQTLDGYRISHIEDINDLFWKFVDEENYPYLYEEKDKLTKEELNKYFGKSEVYKTKDLVWHQAVVMYREHINSNKKIMKNSIQFLPGYEKRNFNE